MNLIFTCGGTAGHINPAIAVANMMKERFPDCRILFIGASGHMEEILVPQAGYELKSLPGSGLSRGKNLAALKQNVHAVKCVLSAVKECRRIFRDFQPDAVIGTGGYASFPALYAAQSMGIPTCVHESNALPGLTTKIAANKASRVMVAFEESVPHYRHPERVEVVGMPVRREFIFTDKEQARKELGLDSRPLVVSAFGSNGAKVMNETVAGLFRLEKEEGFPFRHIHATGRFGWEWMPDLVRSQGVDPDAEESIDLREYIYNMAAVMSAADVIISRAGASTCNEIGACGIPCILIPSPNVTNNHQEKNARVLEAAGGAAVLLEQDSSGQALFQAACGILRNPEKRANMEKAMAALGIRDATERLYQTVLELCR